MDRVSSGGQSRRSVVAREAVLTLLQLLAYPLILALWLRYGYAGPPEGAIGDLPSADLLWNRGLGDLYVSLLTFDFGQSLYFREPVWELIVADLGGTLGLVATSLVAFALLAGLAVATLRRAGTGAPRALVVGVATLASSVPSAFWFVLAYVFLWGLSPPLDSSGELLLAGVTLALPLVGFVTRRVDLLRRGASGSRSSTLRDRLSDRTWAVDGWFYLSYVIGALVVLENLTGTPGLGTSLRDGLGGRDVPLQVGVTLVVVQAATVLGFGRNLAWTLLERRSGADAGDGAGADAEFESRTDAERRATTNRRSDGTASSLGNPRVIAGAVGLAVLLVVGVVGSVAFSRPMRPSLGVSAWMLTAGLATVLGDLVIASAVALLVGVPLGLLGSRVASLGTAIRALLDLIMNVPLLVFVLAGLMVGFPYGLGAIGVGLIPYVFRATLATYAGRDDDAWSADEVLRDLAGVFARAGPYLVVVPFLLLELRLLGTIPGVGPLAGATRLYLSGITGDALLAWAVIVGAPVLSIHLLSDGLQRSLGTHASGADD